MKGVYALIIRVNQSVGFQIKSLGKIMFEPGIWIYVGSAMGEGSTSLENRLRRHFRMEKTIYWHIDHLLATDVELVEAFWTRNEESLECDLAQTISGHRDIIAGPREFGASDCRRGCVSHLFLYQGTEQVSNIIVQAFLELGFNPEITKDGQI